jgi:hypothetical protein
VRKKLRPYQEDTVRRLKKHKSGLVGSGLGSGKTLMAVEMIRFLDDLSRTLVIAPINTHDQWISTAAGQFPSLQGTPYLRQVGTPLSDPEGWKMLLTKQPGFYVIGWEAMRGDLSLAMRQAGSSKKVKKPAITQEALKAGVRNGTIPPWPKTGTWDMVVLDESHRIQNRDSLNKKTLTLIKANRKLALSATPAGNLHDGLWSTLNWLWPTEYRSFWKWAETFLVIQDKHINQYDTVRQITGEKDPGATWAAIPCAIRHRTEDIIDQLPEVIERVVLVPMADVQRRMYDDFEQQAFAWIDGKPEATPLPLTQRLRLRQAALGTLKIRESVIETERWVRNVDIETLGEEYDLVSDVEILVDEDGELMAEEREVHVPRVPEFGAPDPEDDGYDIVKVLYAKVRFSYRDSEIDFNEHAPQPKLSAIKEILSDLPDAEPVIIYTHSAKWARMAAAELDEAGVYGEARAWTGDLTGKQRKGLKDVFGKLEPVKSRSVFSHTGIRILVAVIPAVAEGIDGWQNVCRCEIWASQSDDGLMNEQAKGRLHRPGQSSPVQRWLIQSEESIDSVVDINLRIRSAQLRSFYRDDRD